MEIFYKMGLFMESIVLDAQFSIIWNLKLNVKKLTLVYHHGQIDAGHHLTPDDQGKLTTSTEANMTEDRGPRARWCRWRLSWSSSSLQGSIL